ncbi:secondary thiamine-phosphate synthase enzyme YjbQ [Aureibacillus halotolerans]|uniref:Secondary thiamine-phosphate synthase enzyme n=1 Tax=Aureibacillus halotolerans TaxID=1508390 RepID=A0A4V3D4K5_9BACI|nr:secondary thiamine-phosphate synthase enzyme YjbQ [Aureibacillus halotolerans]TDQ36407.1 secondary thiamine-phosphate synthase enzyme [Aureibacillus halotolerans]
MLIKKTIQTSQRDQFKEITGAVQREVSLQDMTSGVVIVYCPHTTAGITINENADPDVVHDMLLAWDEVYPWHHPKYKHAEGNTASHLKASTVGASQHVIVEDGKLLLGTWQGIYFCEFDGPRNRTYYIKMM